MEVEEAWKSPPTLTVLVKEEEADEERPPANISRVEVAELEFWWEKAS